MLKNNINLEVLQMKNIEVTAAIIINNNEILCMQRDKAKYDYISYKFEFPGGKIENGESKETALMRELAEEMDININITADDFYFTVHHQYPDFSITMHSFICRVENRAFVRKEHISHKWLNPKELMILDWAAADIPIVNKLMEDMA